MSQYNHQFIKLNSIIPASLTKSLGPIDSLSAALTIRKIVRLKWLIWDNELIPSNMTSENSICYKFPEASFQILEWARCILCFARCQDPHGKSENFSQKILEIMY